jgi:uncharacterized membrane protein YoaT (DUF817 family)
MRFSDYPQQSRTVILAIAIYINFFAHHWLPDLRIALFAAMVWLFWRSWIYFNVWRTPRWMPLLLGTFLVATFIWFAENIATFSPAWTYPDQASEWQMVSPSKLGAWFLLIYISFVLVAVIHKPQPPQPD